MENQYFFIFSSGISNCNPEVTSNDVINNLLKVIEPFSENKKISVIFSLTLNCTEDEHGEKFKQEVVEGIQKYIKEQQIKNISLELENKDGPLGAENSDLYNRSKTLNKVKEILKENKKTQIAYISKIDQDDELSYDMLTHSIKILTDKEKTNKTLIYPVHFMLKDKNKKYFFIEDITEDKTQITISSENEQYKITKNTDNTFSSISLSDNNIVEFDNDFYTLIFSKTYLSGTIKNPYSHNCGHFQVNIIKNPDNFLNKQKILSINIEEIINFTKEVYKNLDNKETPLTLLTDWIWKIPLYTIEKAKIEHRNLVLLSNGSTMSKEDKCGIENIIYRRSISMVYMYLYNILLNDKHLNESENKMESLMKTVLPAIAEKHNKNYNEVLALFFKGVDESILTLQRKEEIPFFNLQDNTRLQGIEKDKALQNLKNYINEVKTKYKSREIHCATKESIHCATKEFNNNNIKKTLSCPDK